MTDAQTLKLLSDIIASMSLSVYRAQNGEVDLDVLWAKLADSCTQIADLADVVSQDEI